MGNPWKPISEPFPHNIPLLVQFRYPQGGRENKLAKYADKFTLTASEDWEDECDYNAANDTFYCPEGWYEKGPSNSDYAWWCVSKSDVACIAYWMEIPKVEA